VSGSVEPPGAVRVIVLLARLAARRWLNRVSAGFRRKKDAAAGAARTGTARKGAGGIGLVFLGLLFTFYGFSLSYRFLDQLGDSLESSSGDRRVLVSASTYRRMEELVKDRPVENFSDVHLQWQLKQLELMFSQESGPGPVSGEERAAQTAKWIKVYSERGIDGFRPRNEDVRGASSWHEPDRRAAGLRAIGAFLFLLAFSQLWLGLGSGNQDLGKVEWSLEWLFTFPAPAGRLFLAKVFESTLINPMGWLLIFPFLSMVFWSAGAGGWALPLGMITMLFVTLVLSSIRVVLETWLRMILSLDRLKNVQALCTVVGTCLWLGILWIGFAHPTPAFFLELAPRLPFAALWNPISLPVLLCEPGAALWGSASAIAGFALLFPLASVSLCRHFVRDGLLTTSGTFQGVRRAPGEAAAPDRKTLFSGVLAKDLHLLLRDRNFLVTTLVVPVILFAFQLLLNPALLRGVTGDYRHAATLAYGLGAYILMSSAFHVLSVEGGSLWLLYTFPHELHRILIQKTVMWAGVALIYAGIVLGVTACLNRSLGWDALPLGVTAAVGVVLSAFIAGALGTLAADPLQNEPQRKIRAEIVYLYMFLSSMYGYAIYGPSSWARLVQMILTALLAMALWQKARDRLPYLLDPTEMPPPSIALSDGLVATLAFFILQALVLGGAVAAQLPLGPSILVAYVIAGGLVTLFTLYVFWRIKVPKLFATLGVRSSGGSFGRSVGLGLAAGLAAAAVAFVYLRIVDAIEPLRALKQESQELTKSLQGNAVAWILVLAVVAAPLFEEYIFRGLVFKGLRRSMKPVFAILASAAIFAIVHPPLSFVPVFGLGVAAALAFEGSGSLLAPILAHMLYNGAVVLLNR
jgi:membrane protease YdiL (CAAX protease family)